VEPRTGVNVTNGSDDQITSKLPALRAYQLSLLPPSPPPGSFDADAASRGRLVFAGAGRCVTCHSGAQFTDANTTLHLPSEVVSEPEPGGAPSYASRSATKRYRTAPLRGLWTHMKGGFYHDGRFATLRDVVEHYNSFLGTNLTEQQKVDLVVYLKSL
jgi:cytochrome c peroxidase